jgi:glycosyltransferase involved in cell wall biosynthesis
MKFLYFDQPSAVVWPLFGILMQPISTVSHITSIGPHRRTKFLVRAMRQADPPTANDVQPRVAILLATKQGERFLAEQLSSFAKQTHSNWVLWVSDDSSTDRTCEMVEQFRRQMGEERVTLCTGPGRGHASNFLSLTCNQEIEADFFAYSDQDDIWEADKLARAVEKLQGLPDDVPALYCSRIRLIDEVNRDIGLYSLWGKPPSFANALTQNIAPGHTIVFNRAARNVLCEAGPHIDVASHDWWCYQLITGCGGTVLYDPYPGVRHRQHEANCIGACSSVMARVKNMWMLLNNGFRHASDRSIKSLKKVEYLLTNHNRQILNQFAAAREGSLMSRLIGLWQCGLYRQTWHGNICLVVGAILKKI